VLIENLIEDSQDFRNYNDRIGDSIREIKRDGYKILFKRGTQDIYKIFYIEVPHQPTPFELFDNFNEKFDVLFDIEKFVFNNKTFITKEFLIYNIDRINEDQKKDLIEFVNNEVQANVLYCKLYCKNNKYIGCGNLTVDTLDSMLMLLSKNSNLKDFSFKSYTGSFYKFTEKKIKK
jgi:hypothetical protein